MFILHLITNLSSIKSVMENQLNTTLRCKTCSYTNMEIHTNYILSLRLPGNLKKSYTIEELIQFNFSRWNNVEKLCTSCGANTILEKTDIIITQGILIFQLLLFKVQNEKIIKITNFNIKGIPTAKIRIGANTYKVVSAIFHHGENITDGHYKNVIRGKSSEWILVSDLKVEKCSWPRNSKNAYIFFAEQM